MKRNQQPQLVWQRQHMITNEPEWGCDVGGEEVKPVSDEAVEDEEEEEKVKEISDEVEDEEEEEVRENSEDAAEEGQGNDYQQQQEAAGEGQGNDYQQQLDQLGQQQLAQMLQQHLGQLQQQLQQQPPPQAWVHYDSPGAWQCGKKGNGKGRRWWTPQWQRRGGSGFAPY